MNVETPFVPDLLLRFVPTPYVFTVCEVGQRVTIESNDRDVAQGIYRSYGLDVGNVSSQVSYWKLIRDRTAPRNSAAPAILLNGPLRTLSVGVGTVLIFDSERREVLGFLAPDAAVEKLMTIWVPLLMDTPADASAGSSKRGIHVLIGQAESIYKHETNR